MAGATETHMQTRRGWKNLAKEEKKGLYELEGPKDTKSKQSTESPSQGL